MRSGTLHASITVMFKGVLYALLAALLFGASTPLAKSLLPQMTPLLLAGLLYLGSRSSRRVHRAGWPGL